MSKYSFCDDMSNEELIRFLDGLEELIDEWKINIDPLVYKKYEVYIELSSKLKIAKEREKYLKAEEHDLKADYFLGYTDWYYRGSKDEIADIEEVVKDLENQIQELNFPINELQKYEDFAHFDNTYTYGKNLLEKRLNNKR